MIIKEIRLLTHIIERQHGFYSDKLGLRTSKIHDKRFEIITPGTKIIFTDVEDHSTPFYHFAFNIPENQFTEAKAWASSKAELIRLNGEDEFDFRSWNAHSVYFYDPAGNIIELIARHNLNNQSSEKLSGESLIGISEIGLVVYDVKKFYEELNMEFHIPVFSGDLKTFTAAGDDNGLFIIVPEKRKWFPDCPDAEIFPMEIEIVTQSEKMLLPDSLPYKIRGVAL